MFYYVQSFTFHTFPDQKKSMGEGLFQVRPLTTQLLRISNTTDPNPDVLSSSPRNGTGPHGTGSLWGGWGTGRQEVRTEGHLDGSRWQRSLKLLK